MHKKLTSVGIIMVRSRANALVSQSHTHTNAKLMCSTSNDSFVCITPHHATSHHITSHHPISHHLVQQCAAHSSIWISSLSFSLKPSPPRPAYASSFCPVASSCIAFWNSSNDNLPSLLTSTS